MMTIASTISSTPSGNLSPIASVLKIDICFITRISTLRRTEQLQFSRNLGRNATYVGARFNRWNVDLSITRAQNLA